MSSGLLPLLRGAAAAEARQDWSQAAWLYGLALPLASQDHRLYTNLGNVLWLADQPDRAQAPLRQAIALAPAEALPHRGLGNVLRDLNDFEAAVAAYAESLSLNPDPLTAWNLSQSLLGLERYEEAFAAAEGRLLVPAMLPYRPAPYLHAEGESLQQLAEGPLHLWSEQGFGDTLQYLRWLVPLCQRPHQLCLEVEWQLQPLLEQGLRWLPHPPQVVAKDRSGAAPEPIAAPQAALMSLPHRLGGAPLLDAAFHTLGDGRWQGYLRSEAWPRMSRGAVPRVGVVWAAGRKLEDPFTAREYRKRSLPQPALGALLEGLGQQGVELVNLQHGPDRDQADPWADRWASQLPAEADFAETARMVSQLDLVISVDTAMAHLLGALGHPGWVLLPYSADPRWLRQRSDSVWYPSLRLFRQPRGGDWAGAIESLLEAFSAWWPPAAGS